MRAYGEYRLIDIKSWQRYEHFRHFLDEAPCSISLCDDVDVTELKQTCHNIGHSFYIAMLYAVSYVINSHEEFRLTAVDSPEFSQMMPAVWDALNPVHNVFHEESETYTSIFTLWDEDYEKFVNYAKEDIAKAKNLRVMSIPCGNNTFEASCVPWRHFTSVGVQCEAFGLSPVVAWGGFKKDGDRIKMPLSIQVHHAAADGFHLARFLNEVEATAARLAGEMTVHTPNAV